MAKNEGDIYKAMMDRKPSGLGRVNYPLLPLAVVRFLVLPHGEGLPVPSQGTSQAVGFDLRAATPEGQWFDLAPMDQIVIPTGLSVAIPPSYAGLVLSRSGLAANNQVSVTNAPGLIDPDYRGEIKIILQNQGTLSFRFKRGDRLAQLVVVPVPAVAWCQVEQLETTARGEGGLGSTGVSSSC